MKSLLVSPTYSTFHAIRGGFGVVCGVGVFVVSPFTLPLGLILVDRVDGGGGGEKRGADGVYVKYFPRHDIRCRHYFSSREKCAHVFGGLRRLA